MLNIQLDICKIWAGFDIQSSWIEIVTQESKKMTGHLENLKKNSLVIYGIILAFYIFCVLACIHFFAFNLQANKLNNYMVNISKRS
jgi:hypothetical protein